MKFNMHKIFRPFVILASVVTIMASCNKDDLTAIPIVPPAPSGFSIAELINDPSYSLLKAAATRAGASLMALLSDKSAVFTFFAPDDAAFAASGISLGVINAMPAAQLDAIIRYHMIGGQKIMAANFPTTFPVPNKQFPTMVVIAPPSASLPPGLRLSVFPSRNGINFVNNIPVTQTDIAVANGVVHKVAAILLPPGSPQQFLWNRIDTDADMTYLKAAIQRADQGVPAASTLQAALSNPAANLTVFAPTNLAFQQILTALITQALVAQGMDLATAQATATALASTPAVFTNPAVAAVLTSQTVQGIVVYHMFGDRAFSVNFPTTAANKPTILNSAIPAHPGVTLQATFGPAGVTAATVKGAANATASNLLINPTPAPGGTSDQHYINGVLHKIDQVLRPQ